MEDVGEVVVAVLVSTLAAGFAAALGVVISMFLGYFLLRLGLTTDEGAAWSGIALGIPVGLISAIIAFVCCFKKIRAYGKV